MKNPNYLLIVLLIFFTAGLKAQEYSRHAVTNGKHHTETNPDNIIVLFEYPKSYEIIGIVDVAKDINFSKRKSKERAISKAKRKAAKLGADAIVILGFNRDNKIIGDKMNANVMAIKLSGNTTEETIIHFSENIKAKKIPIDLTISPPKNYNYKVGEQVIFIDEHKKCKGTITKVYKNGVELEFYHKRKSTTSKTKRNFDSIMPIKQE